MQPVYSALLSVLSIMELSAERGVQLPSLILAYSTIDSMGAMFATDASPRVRERFLAWSDRYVLPANRRLRCSSLELYAARCGILHTFTADSDLSEQRGVRRILYAWGSADVGKLERAIEKLQDERYVAVHLSDLTAAVRLGVAQMFEDAESDAELAGRIRDRGARFFEHLEIGELDAFL